MYILSLQETMRFRTLTRLKSTPILVFYIQLHYNLHNLSPNVRDTSYIYIFLLQFALHHAVLVRVTHLFVIADCIFVRPRSTALFVVGRHYRTRQIWHPSLQIADTNPLCQPLIVTRCTRRVRD